MVVICTIPSSTSSSAGRSPLALSVLAAPRQVVRRLDVVVVAALSDCQHFSGAASAHGPLICTPKLFLGVTEVAVGKSAQKLGRYAFCPLLATSACPS